METGSKPCGKQGLLARFLYLSDIWGGSPIRHILGRLPNPSRGADGCAGAISKKSFSFIAKWDNGLRPPSHSSEDGGLFKFEKDIAR